MSMQNCKKLPKRILSGILVIAIVLSGGAFGALRASAATYLKIPLDINYYVNVGRTLNTGISSATKYCYIKAVGTVDMNSKSFYVNEQCAGQSYTFSEAVNYLVSENSTTKGSSYTIEDIYVDGNYIVHSGSSLKFKEYAASAQTQTVSDYIEVYGTLQSKILLDNQSATSTGSTSITIDYGMTSLSNINPPRKTGYTFNGYYSEQNGGGTQYIGADGAPLSALTNTTFKKEVTLYASWTVNTYTITLDNQSATSAGSTSVSATYGAALPQIGRPAKTGYSFQGYYTQKNGGGTKYYDDKGKGTMNWDKGVDSKLYAYWIPNTYNVTLDNQSATSAGTAAVTATYDSAMPSISVPAKTGYAFGGYYSEQNGGGTQYYTATGSSARTWNKAAATTLYAKWTAHTYTVTLDNQSATSAGTASVTASYNGAMPAITVPVKAGYVFGGYYSGKDGSGTQYYNASGTSATAWNLTSGATLYAKWTINSYSVTVIDRCNNTVLGSKSFDFTHEQTASAATLLGDSKIVGAYYPDYKLSSCGSVTVTGSCTIYRDFVSYKDCGLNGSSISDDGRTFVSAGTDATEVTLPETVTTISDNAFKDCVSLKKVTIPNNSVTYIGENAFCGCINLHDISLPYSVSEIGTGAFGGCINLDSVTIKNPNCKIGDSTTTIPGNTEINAFKDSTGIAYAKNHSRNLETISEIGKDFFSNETSMISFVIPDNVISVGDNAFKNCTNLRTVSLGNIQTIGNNAFIDTLISSVVIPDDTVSIGKNAFSDCSALAKVLFEENSKLESIGDYAFARNAALKYGKCTTPSIGSNETTLYLPPTVKSIGSYAFLGCTGLGQIDLTAMTTTFGEEVFHNKTVVGVYAGSDAYSYANANAYKIALWSGYECNQSIQMEENAYKDNTNIYSAGFGSCQTEIAKAAFSRCTNLVDVKYSTELKSIGAQAFMTCTALKSFQSDDETITEWGLSYIGDAAFKQCSSLKEINIYNPNCVIVQDGEDGELSAAITIPSSVTVNAWSKSTAFDYCNKHALTHNPVGTSYQIIFDKNAGNHGTDKIYAYTGMEWPDIEIPVKTGYTFSGYCFNEMKLYDEKGSAYLTGSTINLNNDMMGSLAPVAQWTVNVYTTAFDSNGGEGMMDAMDMTYDEVYHLPANAFSRTGYVFAGWNTQADGKGIAYTDGKEVSNLSSEQGAVVTLFAQWNPIHYTISFDINSGTGDVPENIEASYGLKYMIPDVQPEKEDYTFTGWNTQADGKGSHYNAGAEVDNLAAVEGSHVVLYAEYSAITYPISYQLDGGNFEGEDENPEFYSANDTIQLINPVKKGYTFTGWTGSDVAGVSTDVTIPAGSRGERSYTAHWTLNTYSISYDLDGGSLEESAVNPQSYTVNTEDFELCIPTRTGHIFLGWQEVNDDKPEVYYTVAKGNAGDLNFTAKWKAITYPVMLELDEGSFTNPSDSLTSYVYGIGATLPTSVTKPGYVFKGWSETEDGAATVTEIPQDATGARTYYAVWDKKINLEVYHISYELNGGVCSEKPEALYVQGNTVILTSSVEKEGHIFAGWYDNADFEGNPLAAITPDVSGNKTLYAKWTAKSYPIEWHLNEGVFGHTVENSYVYGQGMLLPTDITRQGCQFEGWYDNKQYAGTAITEIPETDMGSKAFYAKWSPRTYHITYVLDGGKIQDAEYPTSYVYNTSASLPVNVTKNNCRFEGWYDNPDFNGEAITGINSITYGNRTYYAKFIRLTSDDTNSPSDGQISPEPTENPADPVPGNSATIYTTKNITYQVMKGSAPGNRSVAISKTKPSDATSVTIPAKISIKGVSYKVTRIEDKAFKGWKNLRKVTIGKNVSKIGKKVFWGDEKLTKITIKSKRLKSIGGKTLKGVNKKLKIYVPKSKVKKYRKLFKGKGQKKSVKVVAKK